MTREQYWNKSPIKGGEETPLDATDSNASWFLTDRKGFHTLSGTGKPGFETSKNAHAGIPPERGSK